MGRFNSFSFLCVIIITVNHEVLGKGKQNKTNADCGKCGRRIPSLEGKRGNERIIDGRLVKPPYMYPWAIKVEGDRNCSGSIISSKYILTSAYCLTKAKSESDKKCKRRKVPNSCFINPDKLKLRLPWKESSRFRKTLKAKKLITHPDYRHPAIRDDIALIELAEVLKCNSFYQPICLPPKDDHPSGKILAVIGWGSQRSDGRKGGACLREREIKHVGFSSCSQLPKVAHNSSRVLCVVGTTTAKIPLEGDAGAAVFSSFNKSYFAVGLTNNVDNNARIPQKPVAFTKVFAYNYWIKQYVKKFPEPYKQYGQLDEIEQDNIRPENQKSQSSNRYRSKSSKDEDTSCA